LAELAPVVNAHRPFLETVRNQGVTHLGHENGPDLAFTDFVDLLAAAGKLPSDTTVDSLAYEAFIDALQATGEAKTLESMSGGQVRYKGSNPPMRYKRLAAASIGLEVAGIVLPGTEVPSTFAQQQLVSRGAGRGIMRSVIPGLQRDPQKSRLSDGGHVFVHAVELLQGVLSINHIRELARKTVGNEEFTDPLFTQAVTDTQRQASFIKEAFYEVLENILNTSDVDEVLLQQAFLAEQRFLAGIDGRLATIEALPHADTTRRIRIPNLEQTLRELHYEAQLADLQEALGSMEQELSGIEKPYAYSAKGARRFEKGVSSIREISAELDRLDWLRDKGAREVLGMLILESRTAKDREAFFTKLHDSRNRAEELLDNLHFLGSDRTSLLTNILNWLDEVVDAGEDSKVRNQYLQDFISDYYIGPGDLAEPETIKQPLTDTKDRIARQKELTELYFEQFTELLNSADIEYEDIDVFPPGTTEKLPRQQANQAVSRLTEIDPQRLEGLVRLKEQLANTGNTVELKFTNPTKWNSLPYFVLIVSPNGDASRSVCILENPINNRASYVFSVDGKRVQNWQQVAQGTRRQAVDTYGATPKVHPAKGGSTFGEHYDIKLRQEVLVALKKLPK
jgi:hypothetical protein